jgi:hypothetical protein
MAFRKAYDLVADCVSRSNHDVYLFIRMGAERTKIDKKTIQKIMIPKG